VANLYPEACAIVQNCSNFDLVSKSIVSAQASAENLVDFAAPLLAHPLAQHEE